MQSNCSNDRILIHHLFGDGFANIHHFIGQSLLISLATNRRFYIVGHFRYFGVCSNYDKSHNWHCINDPITCCELNDNTLNTDNYINPSSIHSSSFFKYYYGDKKIVYLNHDSWYGNKFILSVSQNIFKTSIFQQKWMHLFDGNAFWIRSHIQYYLWMTFNNRSKTIINELPLIKRFNLLKQNGNKYIAFHIRKTDNVKSAEQKFGVNVQKMYTLTHYMNVANKIRNSNKNMLQNQLQTIYICTDNNDIIEEIKEIENNADIYGNWQFIYNERSERASSNSKRKWFLKHGHISDRLDNISSIWNIIMDIELLRNADFLIGPETSNVFRLATELHFATNWVNYGFDITQQKQTVYTVDIPWMQYP